MSSPGLARGPDRQRRNLDMSQTSDGAGADTADTRRFRKAVSIKEMDSAEQVATGVVMVPNEIDLQRDYVPEWVMRSLEAGYAKRLEDGDVSEGVMHAKFPPDDSETIETYLTESETELGGDTYPADTWVIRRKYHDDDLWQLVEDEVLGAFSIGGRITDERRLAPNEIGEDVRVPDSVTLDGPVSELRAGYINEISDVDQPAVPRANVVELKADDLEKSPLTDPESAEDFLIDERGMDPDEARRLADYLSKGDLSNMSNKGGSGGTDLDDVDDRTLFEAIKSRVLGGDGGTEKDSRTLNQQNLRYAMAIHDSAESLLSSEIDFSQNRFSDDPNTDFDLGEFGKSFDPESSRPDPDGLTKALIEGDADDVQKYMSDPNGGDGGNEQAKKNEERLDSIEEKLEKALGGSGDGEGGEGGDGTEKTLPEQNDERLESIEEKVEEIAKHSNGSQQLGKVESDGEDEKSEKQEAIEAEKEVFS